MFLRQHQRQTQMHTTVGAHVELSLHSWLKWLVLFWSARVRTRSIQNLPNLNFALKYQNKQERSRGLSRPIYQLQFVLSQCIVHWVSLA